MRYTLTEHAKEDLIHIFHNGTQFMGSQEIK